MAVIFMLIHYIMLVNIEEQEEEEIEMTIPQDSIAKVGKTHTVQVVK